MWYHDDMRIKRIRTSVYLDPGVYRVLRVVAAEKGTSITALVEQALLEWTQRTPEARRARRRVA